MWWLIVSIPDLCPLSYFYIIQVHGFLLGWAIVEFIGFLWYIIKFIWCLGVLPLLRSCICLVASLDILSNKRITKALTRLCKCAGWSGPLLYANPDDRISRPDAHMISCLMWRLFHNVILLASSLNLETQNSQVMSYSYFRDNFHMMLHRVGSHVVFAWIHCTDVRIYCTDILIECRKISLCFLIYTQKVIHLFPAHIFPYQTLPG